MDIPLPSSRIWVVFFGRPGGVYFCIHANADHLRGLTIGWRHGFLHCTRKAASYLIAKTRLSSQILRVHELEEPFSVEDPGCTIATATFFDSGHCPGSVMVVFQFEDQFVVNTGDFQLHDVFSRQPRTSASCFCTLPTTLSRRVVGKRAFF